MPVQGSNSWVAVLAACVVVVAGAPPDSSPHEAAPSTSAIAKGTNVIRCAIQPSCPPVCRAGLYQSRTARFRGGRGRVPRFSCGCAGGRISIAEIGTALEVSIGVGKPSSATGPPDT
ncbi:hypothetical protein IFM12276_42710 [Nocardia sputorum]|uniref:Secreted protein n=1 Tax=Nocardia sputorum TaxID=2984338 RepID=A0ABN6U7K2_9NOCA|nr:hypothetical protein IFM12276_42710 [Nocardia sputorum]